MKVTTTTSVTANLTLVLPDKYEGADQDTIRQAINDDEAKVLSVEMPDGMEVFTCACNELDYQEFDTDDSPLTKEETEAVSLNHYFTHYYS